MRLHSRLIALGLLLALASGAARAQAPADEAALLNIWQTLSPSNSDAAVSLCAAFQKQFPRSPLLPVARGLAGWSALHAGDRGDNVVKLFEAMITASREPMGEAGATMARRWLSRLDREKVVAALARAYVEHVAYPASLDELAKLPASARPPLRDRWGRPWRYLPAELKHIRGIAGQRYTLESVNMDGASDLDEALRKAYDTECGLTPVKVLARDRGRESVSFSAGSEPVVLNVGARYKELTLVYVGRAVIVLSDGDHWKVLPCP